MKLRVQWPPITDADFGSAQAFAFSILVVLAVVLLSFVFCVSLILSKGWWIWLGEHYAAELMILGGVGAICLVVWLLFYVRILEIGHKEGE